MVKDSDDVHIFCHRCGAILTPGLGNFYVVRIEAFADPAPPDITQELAAGTNIGEEIDRLIEQMAASSGQELMDQVYRRMTLHLCGRCYRAWIENPTP